MATPEINVRIPNMPDPAWLDRVREEIIDPQQRIIDAHHHLMRRGPLTYLFDEYLEDVNTGHDIRGTVFIDCGSMYRADGPPMMAPLGEVEYANGIAAMSASGDYGKARICAAIVSSADLQKYGAKIEALLDAQISAAPERYRGIRLSANYDTDPRLRTGRITAPQGLLAEKSFRAGFAKLAPRQLSFEAWVYHHQHDEVVDLAQAFPGTTIIVNHIGGLLARFGDYAARRDDVITAWRASLKRLAACPTLYMKLGGLGMPHLGYGFNTGDAPPTSQMLADAWAPEINACVEAFGPARCMFESNFPPDKQSCSYPVLWNAFKRIAAAYSTDERDAMFYGAAKRAYRITMLG